MSATTVYEVEGMNCKNCANAVSTAIAGLPGVGEAVVDLAAGRVAVTADPAPEPDALVRAVSAAGYTLRA
jgi:Cu+-exporting ATPase